MIEAKNRFRGACLALVCMGLVACAPHLASAQQAQTTARTLKVKLKYSGSGTVDEKRRIIVFLFDSPDFAQSSANVIPMDAQWASAKEATVNFPDISKSPVYLVAIYDPTGAYEGMSAPPSGAIVGIYAKAPSQPEPIKIEAGKTAEIDLAFDDNLKIP